MRFHTFPFAFVLATSATLLVAQADAQTEPTDGPTRGHLGEIRVRTGDVFDEATAQKRVLARLVNAVHWQTREEVVRREIWLQPGEPITAAQAAELERNLRATGLFAEVSVRLLATGRTDEVDLEVTTRDRLSLFLGAGASYVGGVTGLRATVGEGNLLGYGDRLAASFAQNSDGEFRGAAAYTDLHVLDSWHTSTLRLSRTDEGDSIDFDLRRPFKHLADPFGYGFGLRHDNQEVDYYRNGDSLASVSDHRRGIFGDSTWANGPTDRRRFAGFVWNLEQHDYQPATGPLAPEIRVPGDTQSAFAGLQANWALIDGYRKVSGIDTIDYVQDITLGLFFGTTVGARWRHEDGAGGDLQPELAANASWATEPITNWFVDLSARGTMRWDDGKPVGWGTNLGLWTFLRTSKRNTLGYSATLDAKEETQDLLIELTLGEDNGLRGYPAREFAGTSRLRMNFEDRYDTGIEFATLRLGAVAFFDAGWVGDHDSLGHPYRSVGVGLRLGSKPLLGDGVFRLDFANPLDDVPGESDGWKVSASVGQVFTFGGNTSSWSSQ